MTSSKHCCPSTPICLQEVSERGSHRERDRRPLWSGNSTVTLDTNLDFIYTHVIKPYVCVCVLYRIRSTDWSVHLCDLLCTSWIICVWGQDWYLEECIMYGKVWSGVSNLHISIEHRFIYTLVWVQNLTIQVYIGTVICNITWILSHKNDIILS